MGWLDDLGEIFGILSSIWLWIIIGGMIVIVVGSLSFITFLFTLPWQIRCVVIWGTLVIFCIIVGYFDWKRGGSR